MNRLVVIGAAGSGKTTMGREVARRVRTTFVDIDDLFWEPGWHQADRETPRRRVGEAASGDRWVIAGNYTSHIRDVLWSRADAIVWLDLPRRISFRRVTLRTIVDALVRRELWPGCRQGWWTPLRTGLFRLAWEQPGKYRVRYEEYLAQEEYGHLQLVRLRTVGAVRCWLQDIGGQPGGRNCRDQGGDSAEGR